MPSSFYRSTFFGFFALFVLFSAHTAYQNGAEGFDGYSFLGQTWRVTDSQYAKHFYEPARPRTFVMVLASVDSLFQAIAERHPTKNEYHLFTCALVCLTMLLWVWALRAIFSEGVSYLTGTVLLFHYLYFTHAAFVLADVLSSTLWAIFFGYTLRYLQRTQGNLERSSWAWCLIGLLAGLIATTKYGHFLFLPIFAFFLWAACRFGFENSPFPWRGMGLAFLAHFAVIEAMYRGFGGWDIGYWYPVKLHIALSKEYIPGAQQDESAAYLASRRWLYFQDLYYAYGLGLFALSAAGFLNWLASVRLRVSLKNLPAPFLIFFGTLFTLAMMHQVIAVKETRYFLPFIPGLMCLLCLPIDFLFQSKNGMQRALALFGFYAALALPLSRTIGAAQAVTELAEDPRHHELPQLFSFLRRDMPHGKSCRLLYICDRQMHGLRLDRNVYGVNLPGTQIERMYCEKAAPKLSEVRKEMAVSRFDELNEEVCFVNGDSRIELDPKPPITAYRPLAIQASPSEKVRWEKFPVNGSERVQCDETRPGKFDCYLSRKFFGWG